MASPAAVVQAEPTRIAPDLIAGIVLEAADLSATRAFYEPIIGRNSTWSENAQELTCRRGPQHIRFMQRSQPRTMGEHAQHFGLRVTASRVGGVVEELAAQGFDRLEWREDHPDERSPSAYLTDPSGNRVQLVASSVAAGLIHHAAFEINNFDYAEYFYLSALGAAVDYYHGWRAEDYRVDSETDDTSDACAPWTRRDRGSYRDQGQRILRPNAQVYLRFGPTLLGLFIATSARQQPPEEMMRGTPRVVLRTNRTPREVAEILDGFPFRYERGGWRFFLRDPSGNFIELECQGP
ncbi:MAG: hypothetical protein HW416_1299 [Chloroflexi bacterium]|nr:hypothetical protein [Chloroflexota bacterium]